MLEHPEPERFATQSSGSERTLAGYLLAEVLQRQPAEVRELLDARARCQEDGSCGPKRCWFAGKY